MPYTAAQCRLFGAKSGRGEKVPGDWKKHCTKDVQKKAGKHSSTKTRATHNHGG